jgi:hypothetical protein
MVHRDDILYCNTGDWVENCTALIEEESGRLELVECGNADGEEWQSLAISPRCASPMLHKNTAKPDRCDEWSCSATMAD